MKKKLNIAMNAVRYKVFVETHHTLLDLIREEIGLTGTKSACEMGECGACTVLLNGEPVNSCLVLAHEADGGEVLTIEGLSLGGELHPIQRAFVEQGAIQCGFCTPGMIMSAKAVLEKNSDPAESEIRIGLQGNLCRCTGYVKVTKAVEAAGAFLRKERIP